MKILLADGHDEGLYKCRKELISRLIANGEQVFVSVPRGDYWEKFQALGCSMVLNDKMSRRGTNPVTDLRLLFHYHQILKEIKPDCVLTYSIKPNAYLGFLCGWKKIPYIANITGLGTAVENGGLLSKISMFLYKIGLRKAQRVFFQNRINCEKLVNRKVVKTNYEVIPGSGVNVEEHCFEPYPRENEEIRFITIGRIMRDKGTKELLTAARSIKSVYPSIHFELIGFPDDELENEVNDANDLGIVEYYGHQDDVHSYIKNVHAVIHPSYHEGMANALLEGGSSGRPVIASNIPGCKETFVEGVSGFGVSPRDAKSLEEGILKFIQLPYSDKMKMGMMARKHVEKHFNRKIIIDAYLKEIYNR